ncbi:hypothetical protein MMC13_006383 [Lambiella insularis]|nr:hypothetical protein [Lambiella insularis]
MNLKNIAVVGPGGNVGSAVIPLLLEASRFNVTAVTRPTSKYSPPSEAVHVVTADLEEASSLAKTLYSQDAVLCCVPGGATKFDSQKMLIDAAVAAGVKLYFASEYSGDILAPHYKIFPTQVVGDKIKIRKYLEEKANDGDIAYTALNGGPFFDMWLLGGHAGFDIAGRKAKIYGSGNNLACWTPLPSIARAVVNMLSNPDAILNRAIFVSGVRELTQNNTLAALEAEIGDKFEVEHVDVKRIRREAHEALARGEYRQASRGLAINAQFNEDDSGANFWGKVENELVGVEPVSVQEAVRMAMDCQRKK